jgi:hypothetical protein
MTTLIILSILISSFFWFWKNSSNDQSLKHQFNEPNEDNNYQALKKLFFAVNPDNINSEYLNNPKNVYGVLIEAHIKDNKKISFACYITGFAGYYQSKGGGLIGGKWYPENDVSAQWELMNLCDGKNLNGEGQQMETRMMATRLTIRANDYLNRAVRVNSWGENKNTVKFSFLTKEGIYFSEVENTLLNNSDWKELVDRGYDIIKGLHKV